MPNVITQTQVNVSSKNFSVITTEKGVDIDGANGSLAIFAKDDMTARQQVSELIYMLQQYMTFTPKS